MKKRKAAISSTLETYNQELDEANARIEAGKFITQEDLEKEARRAMREWMFRPGPIITYLKSLRNIGALRSAINVGMQQVKWAVFPNSAH